MNNLVDRNGWYHFLGYVPKDLIAIGYPRERVEPLSTRDHVMALERRDKCSSRHKKWVAEMRARRDGNSLVLKDLSDEQVLGFARDAYRLLMPTIEEFKDKQASRSTVDRDVAIRAQIDVLSDLQSGVVKGSEIFGSFEYNTNKVLERRMIRINDPSTKIDRWHGWVMQQYRSNVSRLLRCGGNLGLK